MKRLRVQIKRKRYSFANLEAACKAFGLPYVPIYGRVRCGWTLSKALSIPLRKYKPQKYKPSIEAEALRNKHLLQAEAPTHSRH